MTGPDPAELKRLAKVCAAYRLGDLRAARYLLIGRGVLIPEPLEQAGGDPVCALDGARFTVSRWVPGEHLSGAQMSLGQVAVPDRTKHCPIWTFCWRSSSGSRRGMRSTRWHWPI